MLQALREQKGLIARAAKAAGISRSQHYVWMKECEEYKQAYHDIVEFVLDEVESTALDMIVNGKNPVMTIFYLKTKGKDRDFVEKQQLEHTLGDTTRIRELINECDRQFTDSD